MSNTFGWDNTSAHLVRHQRAEDGVEARSNAAEGPDRFVEATHLQDGVQRQVSKDGRADWQVDQGRRRVVHRAQAQVNFRRSRFKTSDNSRMPAASRECQRSAAKLSSDHLPSAGALREIR